MSYRFMRMLIFFDLPTETGEDRRNYSKFRKFLTKNGFIMMQESVYVKLLLNGTAQTLMENRIIKERPPKGIVQMMTITEKQFSAIKYVTGSRNSEVLDTDEGTVFI